MGGGLFFSQPWGWEFLFDKEGTGRWVNLNYLALGLTSLLLGFAHGFDTDHVIDVTDFVSQDPRPLQAALFGARFGIGHTTTVLTVGLLVYTLQSVVPGLLENTFQLLSGIILIVIGFWGIHRRLFRQRKVSRHHHRHDGSPVNFAVERTSVDNTVFRYGPVVTGVMTGMVGTAGVMLLGPVTAAPSVWWVVLFILLYGAGVIGAMCGYGFVASTFFRHNFLTGHQGSISRLITVIPSVLSIALGSMWLLRIAIGLNKVLTIGN